jgi:hypothetical protein
MKHKLVFFHYIVLLAGLLSLVTALRNPFDSSTFVSVTIPRHAFRSLTSFSASAILPRAAPRCDDTDRWCGRACCGSSQACTSTGVCGRERNDPPVQQLPEPVNFWLGPSSPGFPVVFNGKNFTPTGSVFLQMSLVYTNPPREVCLWRRQFKAQLDGTFTFRWPLNEIGICQQNDKSHVAYDVIDTETGRRGVRQWIVACMPRTWACQLFEGLPSS